MNKIKELKDALHTIYNQAARGEVCKEARSAALALERQLEPEDIFDMAIALDLISLINHIAILNMQGCHVSCAEDIPAEKKRAIILAGDISLTKEIEGLFSRKKLFDARVQNLGNSLKKPSAP